ncbi:MAG: GNAT family protein [Bdellovibrionota bacterium]
MAKFDLGKGLVLKTFEINDADALFAAVNSCRDYLREWLPWVDDTRTPGDSVRFIESARRQEETKNGFQLGIFFEGKIVGCIGYHAMDIPHRRTSLGYWIRQDMQGQGIVTRACKELITHALVDLKMHRIELRAGVENAKSRSIPERLGLIFEGIARECEWINDHFVDHAVYAALAPEWIRDQKI